MIGFLPTQTARIAFYIQVHNYNDLSQQICGVGGQLSRSGGNLSQWGGGKLIRWAGGYPDQYGWNRWVHSVSVLAFIDYGSVSNQNFGTLPHLNFSNTSETLVSTVMAPPTKVMQIEARQSES